MLCKPGETARRTMGKKRTARDERPYFFITRRILCPPPTLEFRKPLSTARSHSAAPPHGRKISFCRLSASAAERAVGTQTCFPANKRSRPKREQKRRCARRQKPPGTSGQSFLRFSRSAAFEGRIFPRPRTAPDSQCPRRASDCEKACAAPGGRKRPQNNFAESPKASANGENVFSFRKPAPPRDKAATAYGIHGRTKALPQARAVLRRTQPGRREYFIETLCSRTA